MRKQFHTSEGITERELTKEEVKQLAEMGEVEAQIELGWIEVRPPYKKKPLWRRILHR